MFYYCRIGDGKRNDMIHKNGARAKVKVKVELDDGNKITGTLWLNVAFKGCLAFAVLENESWQWKALYDSTGAEFELNGESYSLLEHYTTYEMTCTRFGFSKGGKIYG